MDKNGGFSKIDDMYLMLKNDKCLKELYVDELTLFSNIAFSESISHVHVPGTIICNVTPPTDFKPLPQLSICNSETKDTDYCIWNSVKETTQVKEDTSIKICKKDVVSTSSPPSSPLSSQISKHQIRSLTMSLAQSPRIFSRMTTKEPVTSLIKRLHDERKRVSNK